ncbi:MAG TPA: alpha/beta hydrolase [Chromatiales bacterium]|nr:alpha/beta hydrolase [Thiotrichales bacterium]HIP67461.1 alpha/beta hydrolase [Chromatiales bacterium]
MKKILFSIVTTVIFATLTNCSSARPEPAARPVSLVSKSGLVSDPVFGGQIYIKTAGDPAKPAVVLVHGLGNEASTSWQATIDLVKKDFFVFTLDLPGFGRSSKMNALYSPKNYARVIHELTKKYVKKSFHLVGHSMGGAIALQYAATYPEDVSTLTLVDAAGILHRLAYSKYLAPLGIETVLNQPGIFSDNQVSDLAGIIMNTLESRMPVDWNMLIESALFRSKVLRENPTSIAGLALVLNDYSKIPEIIKAPTLIIWGDKDKIAPVRTGYVLDALIPKSSLKLIAGGGHMVFVNKPKAFHHLLLQQLKSDGSESFWQDAKKPAGKFQKSVLCKNKDNQIITGNIGQLTIDNCQDVIVRNANINKVMIGNSRVALKNVSIKSQGVALTVHQSSVEITAGSIEGDTAIAAYDSRLDIAGTRLTGRDAVIKAPVESTAIFSLGRINSPLYQGNVIHGRKIISPGHSI